ncbi:hypothetical protein T4D_11496 [Trichinella pseudospiralis]|uniref:Uncharacterized protein n=1 Tax=Trichinella pseudospiralis TaxID=6337 RepID=A0A0V1F329_TRIPS|nr:hypothetical protein T4D_11496 [Trichinella pseudospiralis]
MHVTSLGWSDYFLVYKDDFSRYRQVFYLKKSDDVDQCLKTFLNEVATRASLAYTAKQNGVSECENRILVETVRFMSHSKNGKRNQFVDGSYDEAMTLKTDLYEKNEEEDGSNVEELKMGLNSQGT